MSVINKMLRDLDQRQAQATVSSAPHGRVGGLQTGTAEPINFVQATSTWGGVQRRTRPVLLVLACAGLILVVGASWWVSQRAAPPTSAVVSEAGRAVAPVAVVAPLPASTASSAVVAMATANLAVGSAVSAANVPVRTETPTVAPVVVASTAPPAALAAVATTASAKRETTALGLRMDTALAPRKLTERATATDRGPVQGSERAKGPTPNDALERAQALWNSGSREAAIDLLQEAVVVAERVGAGGSFAQGNPVLLPLVRELTRMQLAESRHDAVWDVLARLEPQLGTAPDLWAIRGNAAQRLGRHQDSVRAYTTALQSRPNEQRWLLGAAVSLAALGQTSSAAEMADKARTDGVVSPEVLAYLRQMGVPLKEK